MKGTIRFMALAFMLVIVMGCGPRDANQKFPLMKERIEWLKSYCEDNAKLMTLWRGQGVSIKFECAVEKSIDLSDLDSLLIAKGFIFTNQEKQTKAWCKAGVIFFLESHSRLRASAYYNHGSLCQSPVKTPLAYQFNPPVGAKQSLHRGALLKRKKCGLPDHRGRPDEVLRGGGSDVNYCLGQLTSEIL